MGKANTTGRHTLRIAYFYLCIVITGTTAASPPKTGTDDKHKPKFLLGLRGGINFTQTQVLMQYTLFSNTSAGDVPASKSYATLFHNMGSQFGIIAVLQLTDRAYLSLQPSVSTYNFTYSTTYTWINPRDVSQTT